jgi:hypothetical protein
VGHAQVAQITHQYCLGFLCVLSVSAVNPEFSGLTPRLPSQKMRSQFAALGAESAEGCVD